MRPLSRFTDPIARKAAQKRGGPIATLQLDWALAAGVEIAGFTRPESLRAGVLTLAVESGRALEAQHLLASLRDRLNAHLGRGAVSRIKLRQTGPLGVVARPTRPPRRPAPPPDPAEDVALDGVEDERLRAALRSFGAALRQS